MWMYWFFFSLHIPFALIFGDSCDLIARAEVKPVETLYWTNATSTLVATCLANASLTDAFNLTGTFNFSADDLPVLDSSALLKDPTLQDTLDAIETMTIEDVLPGVVDVIDASLDGVQAQYKACANPYDNVNYGSREMLTDMPIESCSGGDLESLRQNKYDLMLSIKVEGIAIAWLLDLQADALLVSGALEDLAIAIDSAGADVITLAGNLVGLLTPVATILSEAYCGAVSQTWDLFKFTFCETLTTAVAFEAFCFWMLGWTIVAQLPFTVQLANHWSMQQKVAIAQAKNGQTVPGRRRKKKRRETDEYGPASGSRKTVRVKIVQR
jgi:hypothetical protein